MSREPGSYPSLSYQPSTPNIRTTEPPTTPNHPYTSRYPSEMATLPPPPSHMDSYRPHASYTMYPPPPQMSIPYPPQPQPQQQPPSGTSSQSSSSYPSQPAPRQRTAIACRYCRRRKIRCHGFDSSPDGRCTNCLRFHQECVFTPVSAQAHAFVPAHTAYPFMRNARVQTGSDGRPLGYAGGPQLFGAHGQPLGPVGHHDPGYGGTPQSPYGPGLYSAGPPLSTAQNQYDDRTVSPQDQHGSLAQRRGSYDYPESSHVPPISPATPSTSYQGSVFGGSSTSQSYYSSTSGDQRTSPTSSYLGPGSAGSPHSSTSSNILPPLPAGLHPPQSLPSAYENNRNSSPSTSAPRSGALSVADMLGPTSGGRSSTDSDMLNALNRHRR